MNEQDFANELAALIDSHAETPPEGLPPEEAVFAARLLALRDQTRPDTAFAAALDAQLKAAPRSPFVNRFHLSKRGITARRFDRSFHPLSRGASVAALLLLCLIAVLVVPALRLLTPETTPAVASIAAVTPPPSAASVTRPLPASNDEAYLAVSAPLVGGFRVWGKVLGYDGLYIGLIETTFTSYLNFMWSVYSDHV